MSLASGGSFRQAEELISKLAAAEGLFVREAVKDRDGINEN